MKQNDTVAYSVASSAGVTSRRFVMEYAGFSFVVDKGTGKGNDSFSSGEAAVKDYAWMGAGLYKVRGEATLKGGATCSGAVLINVEGNPLTTVVGVIGVITVVTGAIGLIGTSGTKTGEIIDELVNFVTGPNAPSPPTVPGDGGVLMPTSGTGRARGPGPTIEPGAPGSQEPAAGDEPAVPTGGAPGEEPPKGKGRGGVTVGTGTGTPNLSPRPLLSPRAAATVDPFRRPKPTTRSPRLCRAWVS